MPALFPVDAAVGTALLSLVIALVLSVVGLTRACNKGEKHHDC